MMTQYEARIQQQLASMNRRHFLRGLGACMALPAFGSLMPTRLFGSTAALKAAQLATTATGAPLRTAFVVSVKNKTVITAVDRDHMRDHVFTNIDSAVIG